MFESDIYAQPVLQVGNHAFTAYSEDCMEVRLIKADITPSGVLIYSLKLFGHEPTVYEKMPSNKSTSERSKRIKQQTKNKIMRQTGAGTPAYL